MTAPLADHNKVVIDLASPRISVEAPMSQGLPNVGFGFHIVAVQTFFMGWQKAFHTSDGTRKGDLLSSRRAGNFQMIGSFHPVHFGASDRLPSMHTVLSEEW